MIGRSALTWSRRRGEIPTIPYIELVKRPLIPPSAGCPLDTIEIVSLIAGADYHLQVFIVMMLATAGRTNLAHQTLPGQSHNLPHTMAPWLRKKCSALEGCPTELGHKMQDASTKQISTPVDPTYWFKAAAAVNALLAELARYFYQRLAARKFGN
ncbi:MAG: hypothetical protein AAFV54_11805 [Pseudomonadota bacterium]